MLLPHGYEGQGPEHSSARLERYLQLCGEDNIQVCQPSTAAQYFHLLRRQALSPWRKPLIVMTPKSMLRHKESSSTLEDLARDRFLKVVPDPSVQDAQRVIFCTGKIGHELQARAREEAGQASRRSSSSTSSIRSRKRSWRPSWSATPTSATSSGCRRSRPTWAHSSSSSRGIERLLRRPIRSVKRSASGSPATGSAKAHTLEQQTLLTLAFTIGV